MKNRLLFSSIFFLFICVHLFARGAGEDEAIATQAGEWVLCITDFDVSTLSEDRLIAAGFIMQRIFDRLNTINNRTRVSLEYEYYKEYLWARAVSSAAQALSNKQDERAALIFQGNPNWRYRRNLERIEGEIEILREALFETENNPPVIESEPVFKLTAGNIASVFPSPPLQGEEFAFCNDINADALLLGTINDFHGRFLLTLKIYTVYTRSFIFEESIVFSTEDIESALGDISNRLISVLSGSKPSAIIVRAQPDDTLVLINETFAGRGDTGLLEFAPGNYTITASARDYETTIIETTLHSGELLEIDISLKPLDLRSVEIVNASSSIDSFYEGDAIYHGSLYLGDAPLSINLPADSLELLEIETLDGRRGTAALEISYNAGQVNPLFIKTLPVPPVNIVEIERRRYYRVWGATWITGMAAWAAYHNFITSDDAVRYSASQNMLNENFYNDNIRMSNISTGLNIAFAAVIVYGVYRAGRYLYTANRGSPIVERRGRNK